MQVAKKILSSKALSVLPAGDLVQGRLPQGFTVLAEHGGREAERQRRDDPSRGRLLPSFLNVLIALASCSGRLRTPRKCTTV